MLLFHEFVVSDVRTMHVNMAAVYAVNGYGYMLYTCMTL